MIAHIFGEVAEKFDNSVIVDVNGVGYEMALTTLDWDGVSVGEKRKFFTHHSVRENAEELYGFSSLVAKKMFEMLLKVSGIGPKGAMAIMSLAAPEEVRNAIANADAKFIGKAAGVGKKSAERVIVDLRDKVGAPSHVGGGVSSELVLGGGDTEEASDEALDALIALGFPLKEATAALAKVDPGLSVEERIKAALKR